jgi:hypothetical protein
MKQMFRYTPRAVRQDAGQAMGGDLIRGLVELILNSLDSYQRMRDSGKLAADKQVRITVLMQGRGDKTIAVRDRAEGFSPAKIRDGIEAMGERTSGAEHGALVRGNRGRGLKDLLHFGTVSVRSIHNGGYNEIEFDAKGVERSPQRGATPKDRTEIGVKPNGNGTEVRVHVSGRYKRFDTLAQKLPAHYELRDLCSSDQYELVLVDENTGETRTLRYEAPATEKTIFDGEIDISGYDATAHLRLELLAERCDAGRIDYTRSSGIVIKGRIAAYENTLGKHEGNPYAGRLHGELSCPLIDDLIADFDDRETADEEPLSSNPVWILTRTRDGLQPQHPATQAILAALDERVAEAVAALEAASRQGAQAETTAAAKRDLSELARVLAEERRKVELEEDLDSLDNPDREGPTLTFSIVPPSVYRPVDGGKFAVSARAPLGQDGSRVRIQAIPEGIVTVSQTEVQLAPSLRRPDAVTARIDVDPEQIGDCRLIATCDGETAICELRITPPVDVYVPAALEFSKRRYGVKLGKQKSVRVLAPIDLVSQAPNTVADVTSSDPATISVMRGGKAVFTVDPDTGLATADIPVIGRVVGKGTTIMARYAGQVAKARVLCRDEAEDDDSEAPEITFSPREAGVYPAVMSTISHDGRPQRTIEVFVRHPILRPYFPKDAVQLDLTDQNRPVVADVIADFFARDLTSRKLDPTRTETPIDVDDVYQEHYHLKQRLVKVAQRCLVKLS